MYDLAAPWNKKQTLNGKLMQIMILLFIGSVSPGVANDAKIPQICPINQLA